MGQLAASAPPGRLEAQRATNLQKLELETLGNHLVRLLAFQQETEAQRGGGNWPEVTQVSIKDQTSIPLNTVLPPVCPVTLGDTPVKHTNTN